MDWYKSGDETMAMFMLYRQVDTVNKVYNNPSFEITAGNQTVIKNKNILFEGFKKGSSWSGWLLNPFIITVDYNIYTAPVANMVTVDSINYKIDPEAGTASVAGYTEGLTTADIKPAVTYNGQQYTVTAIAKNVFKSNTSIFKITIPRTITSIGTGAFSFATGIREAHLPDIKTWCSIYKAGNSSTVFSSSLFNKNDTTKWGKVYFDGIAEPNPTEITIPEGVTDLRYAFYYYIPLKKVTFASTVTDAYYALAYCSRLTDVKLNEGIKNIGSVLYGCSSLKSVDVPHSVETLGARAFFNCTSLNDVKFHRGLKVIGDYVFFGCEGLTKLMLPETVDSLGSSVFNSCTNITSVESRAMTPPAVYSDKIFSPFVANATLIVAKSSLEAYKAATGWKNFTKFSTELGVNNVDMDELLPAVYYNLNGYRVNADRLAPGIYIKIQGNKRTKVLVK